MHPDSHARRADVLLEIQRASAVAGFGHVFPPDRYPSPSDAVLDRWQKAVDDPALVVVLAELDAAAMGLAAMRAEWLDALYVVPSCSGVGVGSRLHDHALIWIRDAGCSRCHLWVLEQNARARRFYERRGWRLNGDTLAAASGTVMRAELEQDVDDIVLFALFVAEHVPLRDGKSPALV